MNIHPSHITLNGERTSIDFICSNPQHYYEEPWQKQWYDFLLEWYNDASYIEVQTSGSTGTPKLIRLEKIFVAQSALRTIHFFSLQAKDKVLHCLPTKYIAGKLMLVRALIGDLDIHIINPSNSFSILSKHHFRFAAMVINQVEKLFSLGNNWNIDQLLIGGSAIPKSLEDRLHNANTDCYSSYAMTETATHIALRKLNTNNASPLYKCLDGVSVELNKDNCLCISIDGLKGGVLETKDIAELHPNKQFRIIGRLDNCVISGGVKIYPEQLEEKIQQLVPYPFYIGSTAHSKLGEQLVLHIEGIESKGASECIAHIVESNLDKYERPRQVVWHKELARTENGKIKRL